MVFAQFDIFRKNSSQVAVAVIFTYCVYCVKRMCGVPAMFGSNQTIYLFIYCFRVMNYFEKLTNAFRILFVCQPKMSTHLSTSDDVPAIMSRRKKETRYNNNNKMINDWCEKNIFLRSQRTQKSERGWSVWKCIYTHENNCENECVFAKKLSCSTSAICSFEIINFGFYLIVLICSAVVNIFWLTCLLWQCVLYTYSHPGFCWVNAICKNK